MLDDRICMLAYFHKVLKRLKKIVIKKIEKDRDN